MLTRIRIPHVNIWQCIVQRLTRMALKSDWEWLGFMVEVLKQWELWLSCCFHITVPDKNNLRILRDFVGLHVQYRMYCKTHTCAKAHDISCRNARWLHKHDVTRPHLLHDFTWLIEGSCVDSSRLLQLAIMKQVIPQKGILIVLNFFLCTCSGLKL